MGYLHIENLYKSQDILLLRECFALEKVHGTSAHVRWADGSLHFFSGGEDHARFAGLFDHTALAAAFLALGHATVVVHGEAYGGKQQGMSETYGKDLRFIAFDVMVGDTWVAVPDMDQIATGLGLEVVPYRRLATDLEVLDFERDRPSEVAERRGMGTACRREGVVLRPIVELTRSSGARIIAKHKNERFSERATPQKVVSQDKLVVLQAAQAIAQEWVTPMRLTHVLDKFPGASVEQVGAIIKAMVEDVYREAAGEVVESREASAAIGRRTALLFKERLAAR